MEAVIGKILGELGTFLFGSVVVKDTQAFFADYDRGRV